MSNAVKSLSAPLAQCLKHRSSNQTLTGSILAAYPLFIFCLLFYFIILFFFFFFFVFCLFFFFFFFFFFVFFFCYHNKFLFCLHSFLFFLFMESI